MDPDARKYLMELPQYSLFTAPSEYRVGRGVSRIHPSIVGGTNGTSRSAKPITSSNSFSVFPITTHFVKINHKYASDIYGVRPRPRFFTKPNVLFILL